MSPAEDDSVYINGCNSSEVNEIFFVHLIGLKQPALCQCAKLSGSSFPLLISEKLVKILHLFQS